MIRVNDFFDQVYVLSLRHSSKRRENIAQSLADLGIDFEFFDAVNGEDMRFEREWNLYFNRPLSTSREIQQECKQLEGKGAWGCLKSNIAMIRDAQRRGYDNILILEDDILFSIDFLNDFSSFISEKIPESWKLIQLGCSEHHWPSKRILNGYYHPNKSSHGTFAIGVHGSAFSAILKKAVTMESSIDQEPIGHVFEQSPDKCFVAYPNLIIADVRTSYLRGTRDIRDHADKMKWPLKSFNIPDLNQ